MFKVLAITIAGVEAIYLMASASAVIGGPLAFVSVAVMIAATAYAARGE